MYIPNTSQNSDKCMIYICTIYPNIKYLPDNGQAITYNIEQLKLYFALQWWQ